MSSLLSCLRGRASGDACKERAKLKHVAGAQALRLMLANLDKRPGIQEDIGRGVHELVEELGPPGAMSMFVVGGGRRASSCKNKKLALKSSA